MDKRTFVIVLGLGLALTGCLQQSAPVNQNLNTIQQRVNDNYNVNQTDSLTPQQKSADEKCKALKGVPRVEFSALYGEKQIFCSFAEAGECTQNELNKGECFKEKE